jgi:carbonic anhydrase
MPAPTLAQLLDRNDRHVRSLAPDHFAAVQDEQRPAAVSICCSDSRVSQEGMWDVRDPGWLFAPSTIGNLVWDRCDDDLVVDGSVLYPMVYTDTTVAAVVGHTGCGAITAALAAVRDGAADAPPGVRRRVELLAPVIEDGLDDDRIDPESEASLVDQLVEYNVDRQVAFLRESTDVPDGTTVYGFVYDFQGVYDHDRGRAYLVNADGETDLDALRDQVPDGHTTHVARLLGP